MLVDVDEGLGPSPVNSFQKRDYNTFIIDDDVDEVQNTHDDYILSPLPLPQRLDLDGLYQKSKSPERVLRSHSKKGKLKISPIKDTNENGEKLTSFQHSKITLSRYDDSIKLKKSKRTLEDSKKELELQTARLDQICRLRKISLSSTASDVASSVYSSSSFQSGSSDQRSLAKEVKKTRRIAGGMSMGRTAGGREAGVMSAFEDSDFKIEMDTRPPSTASSKRAEVPRVERSKVSSCNVFSAVPTSNQIKSPKNKVDAAVNTTAILSTEELLRIYDSRISKNFNTCVFPGENSFWSSRKSRSRNEQERRWEHEDQPGQCYRCPNREEEARSGYANVRCSRQDKFDALMDRQLGCGMGRSSQEPGYSRNRQNTIFDSPNRIDLNEKDFLNLRSRDHSSQSSEREISARDHQEKQNQDMEHDQRLSRKNLFELDQIHTQQYIPTPILTAASEPAFENPRAEPNSRSDPQLPNESLATIGNTAASSPHKNDLQNSFPAISVRQLRNPMPTDCNRSLPNLGRFAPQKSIRHIYSEPIDIDKICLKGVKKDPESAQRHFEREAAPPALGKLRSARPTVASTARRRSVSASERGRETGMPPSRRSTSRAPPYCSATQKLDGISHSVGTAAQQLLGTLKSLFPDWLNLGHNLVERPSNENIAELFRDEMVKIRNLTEIRYAANKRSCCGTNEDDDEAIARMDVITRIIRKLNLLISGGGKISRLQQLKYIQMALHCA
ncbi:unnamed protein product [Caenorhabditis auriculariae]|uniref:Uncharacterized protein n=1 Tax=Caenorhabditis auriculariae TaxID=2777116 RepID=A0A8S1H2I4_9PELO|nr:unnamed protein product [Caenorhabditis auriculariae]